MGAAAARQADLLERRETALAGVLSRLEDLDIAEAVTRLQELMLNRQVSQQTYVRLSQSSLFDYLR
ncbi:flagellin, partial [Roseicyclus amphidinii]|uniref:flagellin n=1 Tax=Roseicyclus amphidinii TaxID=3034232 RepID=UPI0024E18227